MKLSLKIVVFTISILLLTLTSCKKIIIIEKLDGQKYIDEYYLYLSDQKQDFVGIDFRNLNTDYKNGHFKGFISYSFYEKSLDKEQYNKVCKNFITWIIQNYDTSVCLFLIDLDGSISSKVATRLKEVGYQRIYTYKGGFDDLEKFNKNLISIITGVDDCGC